MRTCMDSDAFGSLDDVPVRGVGAGEDGMLLVSGVTDVV